MKKLILSFLVLSLSFLGNPVLAAEEKVLTLGETLTLYFTEIFPNLTPEINDVTVKYSGIGSRSGLRGALQRAIYYDMLPNSAVTLRPDEPMSDRAFSQLLRRHFGTRVTADESMMTLADYERFMVTIRSSFSYRILGLMNAPEESTPPTEIPTSTSKLSQSNNYYLLENIYSILQENYLRGQKFSEADLIYGAAE